MVKSAEDTRYQQIPFQFSLHRLSRSGSLEDTAFLDLSGDNPARPFAEALVKACGQREPIFGYNAGFEKTRIKELAELFPHLRCALLAINDRIVDLLPVARRHYYHPSQEGSWSLKAVLPAVAPDLDYQALEGVQDEGMAMDAFLRAIHTDTSTAGKREIEKQLREYYRLPDRSFDWDPLGRAIRQIRPTQ